MGIYYKCQGQKNHKKNHQKDHQKNHQKDHLKKNNTRRAGLRGGNPNCVEQTKGKYVAKNPDGSFKRKGPPYPANECCGEIKKGNNGMMYQSVKNKKGVCTWKKIESKKVTKNPAKKPQKKRRS